MDTEQIRTFLAVVAHGSFLQAARRLHVTQSTVSARIQTLEARLGARLFVRNRAGAGNDREPFASGQQDDGSDLPCRRRARHGPGQGCGPGSVIGIDGQFFRFGEQVGGTDDAGALSGPMD